ncbi:MAG: FHA domain-containing protein [Cyanobacteria bacterium P01_A01_bin.17]
MALNLELYKPATSEAVAINLKKLAAPYDWLTIGRGKQRDNHISLAPANVTIFSRSHCTLRFDLKSRALFIRDGGLVEIQSGVVDKASSLGTWINGICLGKGQELELIADDRITFCGPTFPNPLARQYMAVVVGDSTFPPGVAESQAIEVKQVFWSLARDTEAGLAILSIEAGQGYIMPDCINDDAAAVLGRAGDELRHTSNVFHTLFLEVEIVRKQIKEVTEVQGSYRGEFTAVADDGTYRPVGLSISYYPINHKPYLLVTLHSRAGAVLGTEVHQDMSKGWPQVVYELGITLLAKHPLLFAIVAVCLILLAALFLILMR